MNRDLLEALSSLAAHYYVDAMEHHPGLFTLTSVTKTTREDRLVAPILWRIDQLLLDIQRALNPESTVRPPIDAPDDDIPF